MSNMVHLQFSQALDGGDTWQERISLSANPRKGERGLVGKDVSIWVYEGNLKVEYQATALALYELSVEKDTGKIAKVTNAKRLETHFRSAQLDLWQLSDTEWFLALRRPEPNSQKKTSKIVPLAMQLMLPEFGAVG